MFEYLLVKALFTIFLISLIVLISVIWTKIEKLWTRLYLKTFLKTRYVLTMIIVMVGEFVLIVITSLNWKASIIDTLFLVVLFCSAVYG